MMLHSHTRTPQVAARERRSRACSAAYMAASSTRSNGSLLPARGCQTQERGGREELRSTRRAVGEQPNVVLVDKLFGAFGVFLQAEVHDAAHTDLLEEGQRLLRGVAASVYPVRDPE